MESLPPEVLRRLAPAAFFAPFLAERTRPDGRGFEETRETSVVLGPVTHADASAIVKIGNTSALAALHLSVVVPSASDPEAGRLSVAFDISPVALPSFVLPPLAARPSSDSGPFSFPSSSSAESASLQSRLRQALLSSGAIRLSDLCLSPGRAVWAISLCVLCIDSDGSLFDTSLLAAVAALSSVTFPAVDILSDGRVFLHSSSSPAPSHSSHEVQQHLPSRRLQLLRLPLSLSLAVLPSPSPSSDPLSSHCLLVDPTAEEEKLAGSLGTGNSAAAALGAAVGAGSAAPSAEEDGGLSGATDVAGRGHMWAGGGANVCIMLDARQDKEGEGSDGNKAQSLEQSQA